MKQSPEVFWKKKHVLRNFAKFTGKHLCQSPFFNIVAGPRACNFVKKETLAQVLFCEFCEISKNNFFTEHLWATASEPISICSVSVLYSYQFFVSCKNLFKGGFANQPSKSLKIFLAKFGIWDWLPFVMLRKINKNKNEKETKLSCITTTDIAQRSLHKISRRNTT